MTAEATAGQDGLYILIEIQASSLLTVARRRDGDREDYKEEAATPQAGYSARFTNRFMGTTGKSGMRAV